MRAPSRASGSSHIISRRCCIQRQWCRVTRARIAWIKINIRIQNFSNFTRRCSGSELHPNAIRGDHPRERQHPRSECPVCLVEADGVDSLRAASILCRCACNAGRNGMQCASVDPRPHTCGLRDYLLDLGQPSIRRLILRNNSQRICTQHCAPLNGPGRGHGANMRARRTSPPS